MCLFLPVYLARIVDPHQSDNPLPLFSPSERIRIPLPPPLKMPHTWTSGEPPYATEYMCTTTPLVNSVYYVHTLARERQT